MPLLFTVEKRFDADVESIVEIVVANTGIVGVVVVCLVGSAFGTVDVVGGTFVVATGTVVVVVVETAGCCHSTNVI